MVVLRGTVFSGDEILVKHSAVYINEKTDSDSGTARWFGSFDLPKGTHIEPGGPYRLQLEDGRSGNILVLNVQIGSISGSVVDFQGTGPLT